MKSFKSIDFYKLFIVVISFSLFTACGSGTTTDSSSSPIGSYSLSEYNDSAVPAALEDAKVLQEATLTINDDNTAKIDGAYTIEGDKISVESECEYEISDNEITFKQIEVNNGVSGILLSSSYINSQNELAFNISGTLTNNGNIEISYSYKSETFSLLFEKE